MNSTADQTVDDCQPAAIKGQHAVVLGGSMAGLLAARVLADHFEKVTLVERDPYPETAEARRGTPQANHVHALLLRGRQILEQLFPGLQNEMIAAGAPLVDMADDVAWFTPAGWGIRFPSDLKVLAFTRPVLDFHVRQRLSLNPRIKIMDNTHVLGLAADADNTGVGGVVVTSRKSDADRAVARQLQADLIVDATGRASRAPQWLKDLGYPPTEETVVNAHIGYASRLYRIPENFNADWKCAFVQAAPPERKRGGILFTVEGNRWLVTLIGGGGDYPPSDESKFLEFARSLPVPTIYDAIRDAEPLSPIRTHRATENRLRLFERSGSLPDNFIALGDAVCAFNPVYGQGMTIAALGALTLEQTLSDKQRLRSGVGFKGFSGRFQRELAKVNKAPWMMATGEDFRYREVEGGSPNRMTNFMHTYMDQVVQLATVSTVVRSVLLRAFSMLVPPAALFHPTILFRVLRHRFGGAATLKDVTAARPLKSQLVYQAQAQD